MNTKFVPRSFASFGLRLAANIDDLSTVPIFLREGFCMFWKLLLRGKKNNLWRLTEGCCVQWPYKNWYASEWQFQFFDILEGGKKNQSLAGFGVPFWRTFLSFVMSDNCSKAIHLVLFWKHDSRLSLECTAFVLSCIKLKILLQSLRVKWYFMWQICDWISQCLL